MVKWILLFISLNSFAYRPSGMDLSKYEFSRYVRPQLKSILTEYSSLFISLNETLTPFKPTLSFYKDISKSLDKISKQCPLLENATCQSHLEELNEELKKHLDMIDKIEFTPVSKTMINQYIIGLDLLEKFKIELLSVYLRIDGHIVEYRIKDKSTLRNQTVTHWISELDYILNMFLLSQVDERYQNSLNSFWIDFIRPVNQIILPKGDMKFFKQNLTTLNIRWNELHIMLTKKNIEVSKHSGTLLGIMHNRWNNILKVTLKPL